MEPQIELFTKIFMAGFSLGQNDSFYPIDKYVFQSVLRETFEEALKKDASQQPNSPDRNSRCVCDKCGYPHSFKSSGESGSGSGR